MLRTGGSAAVVLPDKTRCDCVTADHAVEVEFASKWAEAIGQSRYYSLQTGKRAGIVLIIEDIKDQRFWIRLNSTILHFKLPIDTWDMGNKREIGVKPKPMKVGFDMPGPYSLKTSLLKCLAFTGTL